MPGDKKQLVVCVDDANRPNDIPLSKWIKAKEVYTVRRLLNNRIVSGQMYELEEIDLTGCGNYGGFAVSRFLPL